MPVYPAKDGHSHAGQHSENVAAPQQEEQQEEEERGEEALRQLTLTISKLLFQLSQM